MAGTDKRAAVAVATLAGVLTSATPAYAYLDPGTGSMLLQLVLGGVAGALIVGKLYWQRLKDFVLRRQTPEPDSSDSKSPR